MFRNKLYSVAKSPRDFLERERDLFLLDFFVKSLLRGIIMIRLTINETKPTGAKEKKWSPFSPALIKASLITILGGVPINVNIPPILLAKAKGIKSLSGPILALKAILTTIGNIKATVPVLLKNQPIKTMTKKTTIKRVTSLLPANLTMRVPMVLASPVLNTAPPTINRPTIIITIEFENPERASEALSVPEIIKRVVAEIATMSARILP